MHNANKPNLSELPTTAQLLKSTAIAAGVATALLVTIVLPAEYGVDPTRVGSVLGLTEMGRIKRQLAEEAEAEQNATAAALAAAQSAPASTTAPAASVESTPSAPAEVAAAPAAPAAVPAATPAPAQAAKPTPAAAAPAAPGVRSDKTLVTLAPDAAAEVKLVMEQGSKVRFKWASSGGKVNFDTHADAPGIDYHPYGKGSAPSQEGELVAAFTGAHGWFWRNRTGEPVVITLETSGAYTDVKRY